MAENDDQLLFHWSDYLVFILSLVLSGSVGVIQGVVDMVRAKKQKTTDANKEAAAGADRNISGRCYRIMFNTNMSYLARLLGQWNRFNRLRSEQETFAFVLLRKWLFKFEFRVPEKNERGGGAYNLNVYENFGKSNDAQVNHHFQLQFIANVSYIFAKNDWKLKLREYMLYVLGYVRISI